jgi:YVTN family beta-propeller protein
VSFFQKWLTSTIIQPIIRSTCPRILSCSPRQRRASKEHIMRQYPGLRARGFLLFTTSLMLLLCCLSSAANSVNAQTFAYVTNVVESTVSVINTDTNTVITSMPVGDDPAGLAITPDGTRVYVANQVDNTVSVIDTATNTVIDTIPLSVFPFRIALTPTPGSPATKDECKNGGWRDFGPPAGRFKNQGQCVSFVESRSATHH